MALVISNQRWNAANPDIRFNFYVDVGNRGKGTVELTPSVYVYRNTSGGYFGFNIYAEVVIGGVSWGSFELKGNTPAYFDPISKSFGKGTLESISNETTSLNCSIRLYSTTTSWNNTYYGTISFSQYYSKVGKPDVDIIDNGNNTYKISITTGPNGTNNNAIGSHLYWRDDDGASYCSYKSGNYKYFKEFKNKEYEIGTTDNIKITKDTNILARGYTLESQNTTRNTEGDLVSETIIYYEKPKTTLEQPSLTFDTIKPTKKSVYTFNWENCFEKSNNNSEIKVYWYEILKNGSVAIENKKYKNTSTTFNDPDNESEIVLKKGDILLARVRAGCSNEKEDTFWWSDVVQKSLVVDNNANMYVHDGESFQSGQVYIHNGTQFVEGEALYLYTEDGWKESI